MKASIIGRFVFGGAVLCLDVVPSDRLFAETYPHDVRVLSVACANDHDLTIGWQPVATDVYGQSKGISNYNIYVSTNPFFAPDLLTHSNRLASTTNQTIFTHLHALENPTNFYYYVAAVTSNGLESPVFTDMVCKLSRTIVCPPGSNTFAWLAMPDHSPWTNASSLAGWLNAADNLYRWDASRQTYEAWDCVASTGVNFVVRDGEAIGVDVSTTTVIHLFGTYNPANLFVWTHYTNQFNHHWISLPPNSIYGHVSSLATSIPGATKAARYVGPPEHYQSWFVLGSNWLGTNFALRPEEGTLVSIKTDSTWRPKLPYPGVSVQLESSAGYIDVSSLSASATVYDAENDIVQYSWDYQGDGLFDSSSALPIAPYAKTFTNTATWYPTVRVKDSHGFYGLGHQRYDVLSMNLSFSNQSFRPGLGQTSVISYASSTGGYFSTFIYDENSNLVRTLEANIFHGSGAAQVQWDGRNDSGDLVEKGLYYVVISQNVLSNSAIYNPAFLTLGVSLTNVSIPQAFDPYSDGQFPIRYTLPRPARVSVFIRNIYGETLAVVCSNALRGAGAQVEYWNGCLANGSIIGATQRFCVLINPIGIGNNGLIVDGGLPRIENLSGSANRFIPAFNPYGEDTNSVTLSYQLSSGADVRMIVRRSDGEVIQNVLEPGKPAGANQTIWSGADADGDLVAGGLYSITLATESGSQQGAPASVWVEVFY